MVKVNNSIELTYSLLIAMPGLNDHFFEQSLVLVCDDQPDATLGLALNKPKGLQMGNIFEQINVQCHDKELCGVPVFQGGILGAERGFVLHQEGYRWPNTFYIGGTLFLTTSKNILVDLAKGYGPKRFFMTLGYSSWGAHQLEAEIRHNTWLTAPVDESLIFETPLYQRWEHAAENIGVNIHMMSRAYGHA